MLKPKNILLALASCTFVITTIMTAVMTNKDTHSETSSKATTTSYTGWQTQTASSTITSITSRTERPSSLTERSTTTTKSIETQTEIITKSEPITTSVTTKLEPITTTTPTTTLPKSDVSKMQSTEKVFSENIVSIGNYIPTEQEMQMFCCVVISETGYCEDKAQKAVAHTIINRVLSTKYPNTIYDVVTQRNQYSCISNYFNGTYRKGLYPGSDAWTHTMQLCIEAMQEYDFTNGAVAYYNPNMIGYSAWFEQYELVYEDKYGRFFRV